MTITVLLMIVYVTALISTAWIGFRLGGRSERQGTLIILAASAATMAVQNSGLFDWTTNRGGLIGVDVVTLFAFLGLALKSRRFWPLWATAFHLIAVCSHCVVFLNPSQILRVYSYLQGFWAYPIMCCVILASVSRQRARTTASRARLAG